MKKIILSLLLIVSSLASLTACGANVNIKKYRNEVSETSFAESFDKEYKAKKDLFFLFSNDFKITSSEKAKATVKIKKTNVNKTLKGKYLGTYVATGSYDKDNNTSVFSKKYTEKGNNMREAWNDYWTPQDTTNKTHQEIFYSIYNNDVYELDLKAKIASKSYEPTVYNAIAYLFPDHYSSLISGNCEYYIDGNVYTIKSQDSEKQRIVQYIFTDREIKLKKEYKTKIEEIDKLFASTIVAEENVAFKIVNNKEYVISKYILE